MRDAGATPNAVRARELASLALSCESVQRTSLLSDLRKEAVAGGEGFYTYEQWETDRVAEGSGTVPLRLAEELGAASIRYSTPVERIRVARSGCVVTSRCGERFEAAAVVSAVPVGPLRNIQVEGVSEDRMASLRHQRNALAAKAVFVYASSFWEEQGLNGELYSEIGLIGGAWPQVDGVLSTLVPPERLAPLIATPEEVTEAELTDEMARRLRRGCPRGAGLLPAPLGSGPLDAGLHHLVAPRRPAGGRAAPRHPRAALLRLWLRPVGLRVHGGRGPHRSRRRRRGAREGLSLEQRRLGYQPWYRTERT